MTYTSTNVTLGWDPENLHEFSISLDCDQDLSVSLHSHKKDIELTVFIQPEDLDLLMEAIVRMQMLFKVSP